MNLVTPEFTAVVESLHEQLKEKDCVEAEEFRLAKQLEALPLGYDLISFVFLKSDGEVLWFDFLDDTVGSSRDLQGLIRAVVSAAKRYPQLEKFIPERPEIAEVCPACNGTKFWGKDFNDKPAKCVVCAGLGWTVKEEINQ